ncbi:MAG: hypothetical protein EOP54_31335 [Sphingobacteriales bacterium]|nr:MAG: hypothetical protein EOP54_31335 [Sphingobacteriales bacterium]
MFSWLFGNLIGITAISLAAISLVVFWYLIGKGKIYIIRVLAGFQVTMILLGATYIHFPDIILLSGGGSLSLIGHSGHPKTIEALAWALLVGSIFILPALFYLIYRFQHTKIDAK